MVSVRSRLEVGPLAVSPICVGIVGDSGVVRAAYEAGVNFFAITTDMHWPVYEATRRGLAELFREVPGARDEVVVMGMSYVSHPRFCHAPFQEVLEALPSLRRVDVSCLGAATNENFLGRWSEHTKHRDDLRVGARAVGGIFDDAGAARAAISGHLVDVAFVGFRPSHRYLREQLLSRLPANPGVPLCGIGADLDLLPGRRLRELGIGEDKWAPRLGDYVRYALGGRGMSGLLCNVGSVSQLEEVLGAAETGPLTADETTYLEDLSDLHRGLAELAADPR